MKVNTENQVRGEEDPEINVLTITKSDKECENTVKTQ